MQLQPTMPGTTDAGRTETVDAIVAAMRDQVLASRMIDVALRGLRAAMGADGAALVCGMDRVVRHGTASVPAPVLHGACRGGSDQVRRWRDGSVACLCMALLNRVGPPSVLVAWRGSPDGSFGAGDQALALAMSGALRTVLEQDELLHEMSRQARTDLLTGLLNRRGFEEELARRLERVHTLAERSTSLERGVLLFLELDGFQAVNAGHGHEAGDAVLVAVAGLLRGTFRPADLLARPAGDLFAVWLDGADELTAAERAELLRGTLPEVAAGVLAEDAVRLTASVGIAPADPEGTDLADLMHRAGCAVSAAKGAGRDGWQVAPAGSRA